MQKKHGCKISAKAEYDETGDRWILLRLVGLHGEMCQPDPMFKLYRQVRDRIKSRVIEGRYMFAIVKYTHTHTHPCKFYLAQL